MKKLLAVAVTLLFCWGCGPNLKEFEKLKEPQVSAKPIQKMLVVELKGDPNTVGGSAFSALFKMYYSLKEVDKSKPVAPRARWAKPATTPKNEWVGIYGMPVPETVVSLPEQKDKSLPEVKLSDWEYGDVAEILHIGTYSSETPTIEKLLKFIKDNGYKIVGDHEEEYIKGPGMFGKGNPNNYWTIIRYRVVK